MTFATMPPNRPCAGVSLWAALALAVAAPLPASAAPATEVGVTAAVNPQAQGTPPGAGVRTLVLGDRIIHRERIQTRGAGLVQVLLVDGSTFTVGPGSDLVIDEFVYDPAAGDGKLVASFSKGVARFVGGRLSKKPGGVSVKTPVGTVGIRGGIANLNLSGAAPAFSLIFGDELTYDGPGGTHRRIYERGYTMEIGGNGAVVRRTRPQDLGRVQAQLVSRPGQSGGARRQPADDDVDRGVSQTNSGLGYSATLPPWKPDVVLTSRVEEVDNTGKETNAATRHTIITTAPIPLGPAAFRVLTAGTGYTVAGGATGSGTLTVSDPGAYGLLGGSTNTDRTVTVNLFNGTLYSGLGSGRVATAAITVDGTSYTIPVGLADTGATPSTGSAFWFVTGRSADLDPAPWAANTDTFAGTLPSVEFAPGEAITHAGFLWSGPEQFAFAALFPAQVAPLSALDGTDPIYFLTGKGTDFSQYRTQSADNAHIRTYSLSGDPRQMLDQALNGANPYESNLFMAADTTVAALGDAFVSKFETSGLIVVEPDDITTDTPKFMDVSFLIDGKGSAQQSAVSVIAGDIAREGGEGAWMVTGTRRGSVRAAETAAIVSGGSFSSLANGAGDHIFGADADNFVLGYDAAGNGAFGDTSPDPNAQITEAFGTLHVASLETKELKSDYAAYRGTGTLLGYGAGVLETSTTDGLPPLYAAYASAAPGDVTVQFDATSNTVGSELSVSEATSGLGETSYNFAFGAGLDLASTSNTENGGSAYVDNDRYAAVENPNKGRNYLSFDDGSSTATVYTQTQDTASRNYFFSGNAVPQADAALFRSDDNPTAPQKCTCAFMHWGYWGARLETQAGPGESDPVVFDSDGRRRDYFNLATWVAGDLPSAGTIRDLADASATYTGHAIGNVVATTGGVTSQYLASGSLQVNWNFASRAGTLAINDFDSGRFSASATITDTALSDGDVNSFAGSAISDGAAFRANGSFTASPTDVAAGVLGSFSYAETSGNYQAAGTFMGQR